jgi:hypothetical protein
MTMMKSVKAIETISSISVKPVRDRMTNSAWDGSIFRVFL